MKCLIVLAAVVALAAAQLGLNDAPTSVTSNGPPAEEPVVPVVEAEATLDENSSTSDGAESSEGDESGESSSEESSEETGTEGEPAAPEPVAAELAAAEPATAGPAAAGPTAAETAAAEPAAPAETETPAQPIVPVLRFNGTPLPPAAPTPIFVEVTPSSEAVVTPEARSFSSAAPTLIQPKQPSLFFVSRPAIPSPIPTLAPLPRQPSLVEFLSRTPPPALSTPRPYVSYRTNTDDKNSNLLYYNNEINPDGTYKYGFAIDNGIQAEAEGTLVDVYGDRNLLSEAVRGSFSWTSPDGKTVLITYTADENGYRPVGDAIPTIPPQIARALEWTAKKRLSEKLL